MDPDEYANMILVGLLEKFGDIPEVHTFMAVKRKLLKNEELSLEERPVPSVARSKNQEIP